MGLKFGLIGCGGIGELRAQALSQMSHQLMAVSDTDQVRAKAFSSKYACTIDQDWKQLVRRPDIEVVIVSTPPSLHADMTIEALNNGKHVLCEKPLARTVEECKAMNEAATRNGRILATGFNYRFYPSILKARELLDSGIIGELDHIRSYAGYTAKDHNHDWLHDETTMGGGALRDNGIHLLDLTHYFLGDVQEVKGLSSNSVWGFQGCEDNGFLLLKSTKGVIASLQASWTEWRGYRFLIELYGTRGCIRTWCFPIMTQVLWSNVVGGPMRKKTHFFPKTFLFEHLKSYRWVVTESFKKEFDALSLTIKGQDTVLASGKDGLISVEIAQAISQEDI